MIIYAAVTGLGLVAIGSLLVMLAPQISRVIIDAASYLRTKTQPVPQPDDRPVIPGIADRDAAVLFANALCGSTPTQASVVLVPSDLADLLTGAVPPAAPPFVPPARTDVLDDAPVALPQRDVPAIWAQLIAERGNPIALVSS